MKRKKQILVVEDNLLNREMLVEILTDKYSVLEAENGQEALDVLQQHGDRIALILLDVMMPVMDGFTFLDRVKVDEDLSLIPVIVMTQSDNENDEIRALSHGATDFVPKPYHPQVILHRVASIIKLRETAAVVNQFQYDRLTGLYSKEFFYQKVRDCLQENPDVEYTIVCSNIENFKLFNDTFGTKEGDRLLCEIADKFRTMVGEDGICGRFGADRFMCLKERSEVEYDRMVFDQSGFGAHKKSAVMKWGIYEIVDSTVSVEQMCDRAMLAIDSIKGQYNQHYAVYDDILRSKLLREQAITEAMETALNEEQFYVYLQPKYSLHDDGLAGAEALVRWIHPEWGFMSPGEFIPLFEKNGFITRLDMYIWEKVCALLREWHRKGYPDLPVSVNVSRADIYQADITETLTEIVRKYDIEPAQLHLEITESAYTENPAQIIGTVEKLRRQGFVIEMDDFGSGYSSLNMLNQVKMDVLKLDMKFIQNETAKPADQGIMRLIVGLARWMNLSVVAEGVETREQLERLQEIGCDYVQGYFFSRPLPCEEFEKLLLKQYSGQISVAKESTKWRMNQQKLLVIDEDAEYRKRVHEIFEKQFQVVEASNVSDALNIVRNVEPYPVVAVILSLTLPDRGASSFMKAIRQDPMLWRIPVLGTIPSGADFEGLTLEVDTDDFLCKRHPLYDLRRRIRRLLDVARHQEKEQILQDEACRDYLTGLLNRRGFYAAIESLRQEDLPLAICMFDLDDLKKINDQYGHETGDQVIHFFAELLCRKTRDGDILCRYGGDEFVVILRRIRSAGGIQKKAEEICSGFREFRLADGWQTTCSCGMALCDLDEKPSSELIKRADVALYQAKQIKKGGCCIWEQDRLAAENPNSIHCAG